MRKESQPYNALSDGSWDFGNGVIGPSLLDQQHFNSIREIPKITKKNLSSRKAIRFAPISIAGLVALACSGGGNKNTVKNTQEFEDKEPSGYALPFPRGETWFLTGGPHADGFSNGVRYAIDIAPPEGGFCPADGRKFTIDNRVVTASASGEVIVKGDDKNRNDPHHSEIRIKGKSGLTQVYIHLDNTQVKEGDKVKQGTPLGNPSCEFPPGGGNTGPHVHIGLMKDGQAIPIDGVIVGGWTIHENGTMTKDGEKTRIAHSGRYGENSAGIRNDLPNTSNKAVVAGPKDPIPPISATITSKEVFPATVTPTPKPTEAPKPTETPKPTSTVEKPKTIEEQAKKASLSYFFRLLDSTQKAADSYNKVELTSSFSITGKTAAEHQSLLEGKQILQDSDLIETTWVYSVEQGSKKFTKNFGQAEIKNIKLNTLSTIPVNDADKANGIQWKGNIQITFIDRYRIVKPWFNWAIAYFSEYGNEEEWEKANLPKPTIPFTQWENGTIQIPILLKNDTWQIQSQNNAISYPIRSFNVGRDRCQPWQKPIDGCQVAPIKTD